MLSATVHICKSRDGASATSLFVFDHYHACLHLSRSLFGVDRGLCVSVCVCVSSLLYGVYWLASDSVLREEGALSILGIVVIVRVQDDSSHPFVAFATTKTHTNRRWVSNEHTQCVHRMPWHIAHRRSITMNREIILWLWI